MSDIPRGTSSSGISLYAFGTLKPSKTWISFSSLLTRGPWIPTISCLSFYSTVTRVPRGAGSWTLTSGWPLRPGTSWPWSSRRSSSSLGTYGSDGARRSLSPRNSFGSLQALNSPCDLIAFSGHLKNHKIVAIINQKSLTRICFMVSLYFCVCNITSNLATKLSTRNIVKISALVWCWFAMIILYFTRTRTQPPKAWKRAIGSKPVLAYCLKRNPTENLQLF